MRKILWLPILGLSALGLALAVGWAIRESSLGQAVELRAYDLRFQLRGPLDVPDSPEITLLMLDDESFDRIGKPLILWQGELGRVLKALSQAGARIAALDLLLPDVAQLDPSGQRELVEALLEAPAAGMPVVLAYRVRAGEIDQPPAILTMAAGEDQFGFVNLTTDADDFVRRQELAAVGESGFRSRSWAALIAEQLLASPLEVLPEGPLLINYLGLSRFRHIPFWRALDAWESGDYQFLEREFAGRAVLVGLDGDEDRHPTPLYYFARPDGTVLPRRTLGLEIHAHTLSTLLSRQFIELASPLLQWLAIIGLSALVVALALTLSPFTAMVAAGLTVSAYLAVALVWTFESGIWLEATAPVGAALIGLVAGQAGRYLLQGREQRKLRRLFQRYVSPTVVEQLLARSENLILTGELREVTILFSDLRGFTSLSEQLTASEVVSRLNQYFSAMVEVIHRNGGMVDKFIGDAIMAVFGAPLETSRHPDQAVQAGLEMISVLKRLNCDWEAQGLPTLRMGVGIHSGEAVLGNVGSSERLDYTVIGDVVNTASRLETMTKELGCSLLVSAETRNRLVSDPELQEVGEVHLKGKAVPVKVYRNPAPS
jgi:adenylate cyclase